LKKGVVTKMGQKPPADLDREGKRKWVELCDAVDPDDLEVLANFCRQHATLLGIRAELAKQRKSGTFQTLTKGRDSTLVLNPLLTAETRLVAALNRQLRTLGLAPTADEQARRKKKPASGPPPPGMKGRQAPPWGWELEIALCRGRPNPTPKDLKREKQWDEWLAARKK
jgi:phage terminase small subunit